MPIIVHSSNGTVIGVTGSAQIRAANGKFRPLEIGDFVQKGDVLLTSQDGIVEFSRVDEAPRVAVPAESLPALIAAIDKGEPAVAPAAGPAYEDGTGLTAAQRIARVSEQVDSMPAGAAPAPFTTAALEERRIAPESLQATRQNSNAVIAVEEGPPVGLRLGAPATGTVVATLTVDQVPAIGEVRTADGATLAVGAALTPGQLPGLVYVPPAEYDGRSRVGDFAYTVNTALTSVTQRVTILVQPVNDAPTAASDQGATLEDTSVALTLQGQDIDGNVVGFTLLDISPSGRILLADGVTRVAAVQTISVAQAAGLRFAPNADFNGDVELLYSAVDDAGRPSAPARYSLTIAPVNDAPRAAADTALFAEDGSVIVDVLRNDADVEGDSMRIAAIDGQPIALGAAVQLPRMSVALNPDGTLTLTPRPDFNGPVTFTYTVSDGSLAGGATVAVNVTPVNDAPATSAVTLAATAEDSARLITQAQLLANASDIDGPSLTATGLGVTTGSGSLVDNGNGTWSYTPALNDNSSVGFSYNVSDGTASVAGSAMLDLTPVNDAPITSAVTLAAIAEDSVARLITQAELLASASDVDGPSLSASGLAISSGNGSLVDNGDGTWNYTPALDDDTAVSFSYSVSDGTASVAGSAALDITPVADQPPSGTPPNLVAPAAILTRVAGDVTVTSEAAISQANLERTSGALPLSLDTFDPPPGPVTADPGTVNVIDGGLANQAMSLRAGERIAFDWTFFNGENVAANIQAGINDMLLLVVTGPNGSRQVVQIASSEETGPNVNGGAADATGTFVYSAAATGNYSFTWLVVNAVDPILESSASIAAPEVMLGANRFADYVPFDISAQSTDPNTADSLRVSVSGLQAGEAFTQGTDLGGGVWSFTAADLVGLEFLPAAGFTGSRILTVGASTVDPVLGVLQAPEQQTTVTVQQIPLGTDAPDALLGGASDDLLLGGSGDDTLDGGAGADRLLGGSGNDILIGSTGSDTFDWFFGDVAGAGAPALDRIADFDTALPSAGGDVLDLRDLLLGELKSGSNPGNLEQYLDFDTTSIAGSTVVRINGSGAFVGGAYAAAAETQRIVLEGVDLRAPAVLGLGPSATDNDVIGQLLQRGHLVTDGP